MSATATPQSPTTENSNVRVMVRVRCFNPGDATSNRRPVVRMRQDGRTCAIVDHIQDPNHSAIVSDKERAAFTFDQCFWSVPEEQAPQGYSEATMHPEIATQADVYAASGVPALDACFAGFNVCVFAYGQTGSGKTYTMLGSSADPGLSPRLLDELFVRVTKLEQDAGIVVKAAVECCFFEIYNEKVRDLFSTQKKVGEYDAVKIRHHPVRGVFIDGLQHFAITSGDQAKRRMDRGIAQRAAAPTAKNPFSSRSHAVFQLSVTINDGVKGTSRVSTVNLVDLAGAERNKQSQAEGATLREATNINKSLLTLRKVIDVLIDASAKKQTGAAAFNAHRSVYRESVLTWVLSDSLGGNSKTQMIATISPHCNDVEDTLGTLRYAQRAKAIVCTARVNEAESAVVVESMREQIAALKKRLAEGGSAQIEGRKLLPSEIKEEIELREKEIAAQQEKQEELAVKLEQATQREEEMATKIDEIEGHKQHLAVKVTLQQRERFAAAFRNAFRIASDKKKAEVDEATIATLANEGEALRGENATLKEENAAKESRVTTLTTDLAAALSANSQMKRHISAQSQETVSLRAQIEKLTERVRSEEARRSDAERTVHRIQTELLACDQQLSREKAERALADKQNEASAKEAHAALEQLRKRKDKYKEQAMERNAKATACDSVIDALQTDRTAIVAALQTQQNAVAATSRAADSIAQQREQAHGRIEALEAQLAAKQQDVDSLSEALREYQAAAAQWVAEHMDLKRSYKLLEQQLGVHQQQHINKQHTSPSSPWSQSPDYQTIAEENRRSLSRAASASPAANQQQQPYHRLSSAHRSPSARWSTPTGRR